MAYPYTTDSIPEYITIDSSDDDVQFVTSRPPTLHAEKKRRKIHKPDHKRLQIRNEAATLITVQNAKPVLVPPNHDPFKMKLVDGVASDITYVPGATGPITVKLFPNPSKPSDMDKLKRFYKYHFEDGEERIKNNGIKNTIAANQGVLSKVLLERYKATEGFRIIDAIGNGLCGWFAKALADNTRLKRMTTDRYGNGKRWAQDKDLVSNKYITCILTFSKQNKIITEMQLFNDKGALSSNPEDRSEYKEAGIPRHLLPASKTFMQLTKNSKIAVFINSGQHWMLLAPPTLATSPTYFGTNADPLLWTEPGWRSFLNGLTVQDTWKQSRNIYLSTKAQFKKLRVINGLPESF